MRSVARVNESISPRCVPTSPQWFRLLAPHSVFLMFVRTPLCPAQGIPVTLETGHGWHEQPIPGQPTRARPSRSAQGPLLQRVVAPGSWEPVHCCTGEQTVDGLPVHTSAVPLALPRDRGSLCPRYPVGDRLGDGPRLPHPWVSPRPTFAPWGRVPRQPTLSYTPPFLG